MRRLCHNVRRQRFRNTRTLARTTYEALEPIEGFRKDEEKAANSNEQSRKFVQDATATVTGEWALTLPKYKSFARSIQRQHDWGNISTTLKFGAIPLQLQLTLRGENFSAYDSGCDDEENFLQISTKQSSDLLESCPQRHVDGTFKCCPALS